MFLPVGRGVCQEFWWLQEGNLARVTECDSWGSFDKILHTKIEWPSEKEPADKEDVLPSLTAQESFEVRAHFSVRFSLKFKSSKTMIRNQQVGFAPSSDP